MQNQEHTTHDTTESAATAHGDTPPKMINRVVTFFTKMYSRRGTLTCKEFQWSALYVMIIAKKILALSQLPTSYAVQNLPASTAGVIGFALLMLYGTAMFILLFFYPLFNICMKILHAVKIPKKFLAAILILCIFAIDSSTVIIDGTSTLKTLAWYGLFYTFIIICYYLGKHFKQQNGYSTD